MALSTLLQALISIIFIYLILSLLTSELQEYLATFSEARAKRLKQSIRQMLGEQDYPFYLLDVDQGTKIPKDPNIWLKDEKINLVLDTGVIFENNIWIKNNDNTEVKVGEIIEDPASSGNGFVKGSAVNKSQKDIWLDANQQEVDASLLIEEPANSGEGFVKSSPVTKDSQSLIWTNDTDNTEVNANDVIEEPADSEKGFIKGVAVTKNQKDIWQKNDTSPTEVDANNVIEEPANSGKGFVKHAAVTKFPVYTGVNSLTEKLYNHPNIQALNQSAFAWLSVIVNIFAKKKKKVRISCGPSYIEDPKLFAETLVDVIKRNSSDPNGEIDIKSLKFYTPAISVLEENLGNSVESAIIFLEEQYKRVQARSTGVYKRNAKGLSFLVGFLIAMLLNADTFNMISSLTKNNSNAGDELVAELDKNPQLFQCDEQNKGDEPNKADCFDAAKQEQFQAIFNNIDILPLGWNDKVIDEKTYTYKKISEFMKTLLIGEESECNEKNISTNISNTKVAETEVKNANNEEEKKLAQSTLDQLKSTQMEAQKACYKELESKLIANDQNMGHYLISLASTNNDNQFIENLKSVRDEKGNIPTDKISKFYDQLIAFRDQNEKNGLALILAPNNNSLSLPEQIQSTVEKQGGKGLWGWIKVIFGWLITAIALSMGAPFWFDQLSRIMNVRNSSKQPGSAPPSPPSEDTPLPHQQATPTIPVTVEQEDLKDLNAS
jgi:hypothetical protein